MPGDVRASYDVRAQEYAAFALRDLDRVPTDRAWLHEFAELVAHGDGAVADLGCGPGHVTNYLSELGLAAIGYDIAPAMIELAQCDYRSSNFQVGDLADLAVADSCFAGLVARYSVIHTLPGELPKVFREWARVLQLGAPLLLSFFASDCEDRHGSPFDHAVVTAYELFPAMIAGALIDCGFDCIKIGIRGPLEGERLLDHATILAILTRTELP
jgi:SAM-dependent methyltransferase